MTRRFARRFVLFLAPFVVYVAAVLLGPLEAMTFRTWEALSAYSPGRFDAPFYPNQRLSMVEAGDLGPHTQYAVRKSVTFETDDFGNRSRLPRDVVPDVLIAGDSMAHGCGLDQKDMLAEQLAALLPGRNVYTVELKAFLHDPQLETRRAPIVVVERVERNLRRGVFSLEAVERGWGDELRDRWAPARASLVALDRVQRAHVYATLSFGAQFARRTPLAEHDAPGAMLFTEAEIAGAYTEEGMEASLDVLRRFQEVAKRRGSRMIVLPVPDKETVYAERVPVSKRIAQPERRGDFLEAFEGRAVARGLEVCDLRAPFRQSRERGLYQLDDTHWSAEGVRIAAECLAQRIDHALESDDTCRRR